MVLTPAELAGALSFEQFLELCQSVDGMSPKKSGRRFDVVAIRPGYSVIEVDFVTDIEGKAQAATVSLKKQLA